MSPNGGNNTVSSSAEEVKSELLGMISGYYNCGDSKEFDINDLNRREEEIIRFVSDNKTILGSGATLIIHIGSYLRLDGFNIALYNYRRKAWSLYTDILRILLSENENPGVNKAVEDVASKVVGIRK